MRHYLVAALGLVSGATLFAATPASAQSTVTWVSGVGSDANPCSRTAPCLTFAGAVSKTNAGGQVNCIDQGSFGAVTISQSVTIDCDIGSIVVTSGNAVTVAAGANDVVTIRGVRIDGALASSGNGIHYTSGGKVVVDGVTIRNFLADGIDFRPTGDVQLFLTDTAVVNNRSSIAGAGVLVIPSGTPTVKIALNRASVNGNTSAAVRVKTSLMTGGGITIKARDSAFNYNAFGIVAQAPSGTAPVVVTVDTSEVAGNTNHGLGASGANAQFIVSGSMITGNGVGAQAAVSGAIYSAGDNTLTANTSNGAFSSTIAKQ